MLIETTIQDFNYEYLDQWCTDLDCFLHLGSPDTEYDYIPK